MENVNERDLKEIIKLKKKENKKGRFSKWVVSLVIFLNVVFACAVLYVFLRTSSEPTALVVAWFGFTTVELWELSKIRRNKK